MLRLITAALLTLAATPTLARTIDLTVARETVEVEPGRKTREITINGTVPGPVLRLKEGEDVDIRVTNRLPETTSIHWHGILLPGPQDGSPGFNAFHGIKPGETYTYRFKLRQSGTYWYHAHSATHEQDGLYGALVIEPAAPEPFKVDREQVVVLSEHTREDPERVLRNLKGDAGYYNLDKRTFPQLLADAGKFGWKKTLAERSEWAKMRMDATDITDVRDYRLLANGKPSERKPWIEAKPGERVRLRLINASAMSFLDVRSPDVPMTVVASDGRAVEPVTVDELRMGVAETYDVIVEVKENRPYRLYAETLDRQNAVLAVIGPDPKAAVAPPEKRPQPILLLSEMGHDMGGPPPSGPATPPAASDPDCPPEHAAMGHCTPKQVAAATAAPRIGSAVPATGATPLPAVDYGYGTDPMAAHIAMGHMKAMPDLAKAGETDGSGRVFGWSSGAPYGARVLSLRDLVARDPQPDTRAPSQDIVIKVQGNMERYIWTLNGKKFGEAPPVRVKYGERVRIIFVNETMMAHPMHLHGMFFQLENGQPIDRLPDKTVVAVAPGRTQSVLLTANEPGEWPLHCHLLYHMESGMMQKLVVATVDKPDGTPAEPDAHAHHGAAH
jgi:CopA family copper-resistance protein